MRSAIYKNKARNSIPIGMAKMATRLSHSGTSLLHSLLFLSLYMDSSLSVGLLHVDVPRSKHSDQKVRFHALGQAVCQLSASVDPFDLLLGGTSRMSSQHGSTELVAVPKAQYPNACPAPYVQLHMTSDRSGSGNL